MAKKMTRTAMRDADLQQVLSDLPRQLIGMNRAAFAGDKQVRHAAVGHERGTHVKARYLLTQLIARWPMGTTRSFFPLP